MLDLYYSKWKETDTFIPRGKVPIDLTMLTLIITNVFDIL